MCILFLLYCKLPTKWSCL